MVWSALFGFPFVRISPMKRLCLALVLAFAWSATVQGATPAPATRTKVKSPLDVNTMKAALRTATPEEEGFIEKVVTYVEKGILPLDMVESTFLWAKKKSRFRFQYFKRAMILRAEQIGVRLEKTTQKTARGSVVPAAVVSPAL
jgi:hypothetical protein